MIFWSIYLSLSSGRSYENIEARIAIPR